MPCVFLFWCCGRSLSPLGRFAFFFTFSELPSIAGSTFFLSSVHTCGCCTEAWLWHRGAAAVVSQQCQVAGVMLNAVGCGKFMAAILLVTRVLFVLHSPFVCAAVCGRQGCRAKLSHKPCQILCVFLYKTHFLDSFLNYVKSYGCNHQS